MRLIFILFLMCLCHLSFSQNILVDKVNQDGSRILATTVEYFRTGFTDRNPIGFNVICVTDSSVQRRTFAINVYINSTVSYTIPKNGIILFKTTDGIVVELKQDKESYNTKDVIGNYIPIASTRVYTAEGTYPIRYNELGLLSCGVQKIRIETQFENLDINYSSKKAKEVGEFIGRSVVLILNNLKVKKDIREGF